MIQSSFTEEWTENNQKHLKRNPGQSILVPFNMMESAEIEKLVVLFPQTEGSLLVVLLSLQEKTCMNLRDVMTAFYTAS